MKIKNLIILLLIVFSVNAVFAQQKIISLGPLATKELYLLGVGDSIVGDTTYCNWPEAAKHKTKIGTIVNLNIEKIISLKPDIIFANGMTDRKQLAMLKKLGIKDIIINDYPKSYEDMCNQFLKIGNAVGKEKKAEQMINESQQKVQEVISKTKDIDKVKVFVQIGSNPLFAAAGGTFIDDFIRFAGGKNIAEKNPNGIFSIEKVVEDKPEVIIVSLMGSEANKSINTWKKYDTIPAVKNNRVYSISSYKLCSPDPIAFPEVLQEVTKLLHPELKIKD